MKQGKKGSENAENELLKELELLREQARKAALLEKENQDLKQDKEQASKENEALKQQLEEQKEAVDDLTQKWHDGEREIEKLKYLLFEAG